MPTDKAFTEKNGASPPVNDEGSDLDQLRVQIDRKYYSRTKTKATPMREEAFYGLLGEAVKVAAPVTEACPEALLSQLLVCVGNVIGRGPYFNQAGYHHTNEYMILVGDTSQGRKGTSWRVINELTMSLDPGWHKERIFRGIQSGEALIHAIRDDKTTTDADGEPKLIKGVDDKRLMILEEEFARFLGVGLRKGNPLSATVREAFDSPKYLSAQSKTNPETATDAHISLVAHVTPIELMSMLNRVEVGNGFVNRMIFIESREVKRIPRARIPDWKAHNIFIGYFHSAIAFAKSVKSMGWTEEAGRAWDDWYMSRSIPGGSIGNILARSEAHILRIAMIYALLDKKNAIGVPHFKAALAFWDYAAQSARRIFGNTTGDKIADKILAFIQQNGAYTRTALHAALNRNVDKADLDFALNVLVANGMARITAEVDGDKAAEVISPASGLN
jgi:hypothetical protein